MVNMQAMPDSWKQAIRNDGTFEDIIFIEGWKMPSWNEAVQFVFDRIWDKDPKTLHNTYIDAVKYLQLIRLH